MKTNTRLTTLAACIAMLGTAPAQAADNMANTAATMLPTCQYTARGCKYG